MQSSFGWHAREGRLAKKTAELETAELHTFPQVHRYDCSLLVVSGLHQRNTMFKETIKTYFILAEQ